jgi:integrase
MSMTRRSGQNGHIEKHHNNWRVRFWMDVVGQENRALKSVIICPISGPGALGASERARRAKEIIAASGADSVENFQRVEAFRSSMTFRDQSARWITNGETRKRRPFKPATANNYHSVLNKWLNPILGDVPLCQVDNKTVKAFVTKLTDAKLSPKSVVEVVAVVKQVVASAIDDNGNELFPRKWNHDFIDLPVVKKNDQHRPTVETPEVSAIIKGSEGRYQALYALLAGTGMRVGEALAIRIEDDPERTRLSGDCKTLYMVRSIWKCKEQEPKTDNSVREIDLHPALAEFLKGFIGSRTSGWLFETNTGKPMSQRNILRELNKLNNAGFHVFRRFRVTNLRVHGVPEDIIRFWIGQADKSITDRYSMMKHRLPLRHMWVKRVGLGFQLPDICTPSSPRGEEEAIAIAA